MNMRTQTIEKNLSHPNQMRLKNLIQIMTQLCKKQYCKANLNKQFNALIFRFFSKAEKKIG